MNAHTASRSGQTVRCGLTGRPHAANASYAVDSRSSRTPSTTPRPWLTKPRWRDAVILGSFCRSDPAAALRGLANGALSSATSDSFSFANSSTAKNTSPRTSRVLGSGCSSRGRESTWDHGDGGHVGGHVLAEPSVTAGGRPGETSVLVQQVDREPVHLQLAEVAGPGDLLLAELTDGPLGPTVQLLAVEHVVQAEQPHRVLDRRERGGRRTAHLLGRRVGRPERRERVLDRVQLAHGGVELAVGDRGGVEHVIAPTGLVQSLGQLGVPLPGLGVGFGLLLARLRGVRLGGVRHVRNTSATHRHAARPRQWSRCRCGPVSADCCPHRRPPAADPGADPFRLRTTSRRSAGSGRDRVGLGAVRRRTTGGARTARC